MARSRFSSRLPNLSGTTISGGADLLVCVRTVSDSKAPDIGSWFLRFSSKISRFGRKGVRTQTCPLFAPHPPPRPRSLRTAILPIEAAIASWPASVCSTTRLRFSAWRTRYLGPAYSWRCRPCPDAERHLRVRAADLREFGAGVFRSAHHPPDSPLHGAVKDLREEFAQDALAEHAVEPDDPAREVPNPEWARVDAQLRQAHARWDRLQAE